MLPYLSPECGMFNVLSGSKAGYTISFVSARIEGYGPATEAINREFKLCDTVAIRVSSSGRSHFAQLKMELFNMHGAPCDLATWQQERAHVRTPVPTVTIASGETSTLVGGVRFSLTSSGRSHQCSATLSDTSGLADVKKLWGCL